MKKLGGEKEKKESKEGEKERESEEEGAKERGSEEREIPEVIIPVEYAAWKSVIFPPGLPSLPPVIYNKALSYKTVVGTASCNLK